MANPKCHSRSACDTFSARNADSTGLFLMPITRGGRGRDAHYSARPHSSVRAALPPVRDLLLGAKHLLVEATEG